MGGVMEYACHYCGRTDGRPTKDHKVPKVFGGGLLGPENIVLCCQMCNLIKCSRHYGMFVAFFDEFLYEHGEQYYKKNPDASKHIRQMVKKFDAWLRKQNAPVFEEQMPRRRAPEASSTSPTMNEAV
jgi:hypothetical protein